MVASARERLLRRARQAETASQIDKWLNSPGLQRPKALLDMIAESEELKSLAKLLRNGCPGAWPWFDVSQDNSAGSIKVRMGIVGGSAARGMLSSFCMKRTFPLVERSLNGNHSVSGERLAPRLRNKHSVNDWRTHALHHLAARDRYRDRRTSSGGGGYWRVTPACI